MNINVDTAISKSSIINRVKIPHMMRDKDHRHENYVANRKRTSRTLTNKIYDIQMCVYLHLHISEYVLNILCFCSICECLNCFSIWWFLFVFFSHSILCVVGFVVIAIAAVVVIVADVIAVPSMRFSYKNRCVFSSGSTSS